MQAAKKKEPCALFDIIQTQNVMKSIFLLKQRTERTFTSLNAIQMGFIGFGVVIIQSSIVEENQAFISLSGPGLVYNQVNTIKTSILNKELNF